MPAQGNLYIDSEGVKRGYYVYLHRDRSTGEVFYVGKGKGRRAWRTDPRNGNWKEKVSSLTSGWDVEIAKQDLSEIEAFAIEAELVEKFGGCATNGGTLTNLIPGGEDPVSTRISVHWDDRGWSTVYYEARKFHEFSRDKQEVLVKDLIKELDVIMGKLEYLEQEAEDNDDEKLSDGLMDIDSLIGELSDVSSDLLLRRVSWKDFAIGLEDTFDSLELELVDIAQYHESLQPPLKQAFEIAAKALLRIDSGNRQEAEETATRMTRKG